MEVIRAKVLGFCMGVRRAEELAVAEADRKDGGRVYTYGPLVHNSRVLADLKKRGIEIPDELPQDLNGHTVIICAHGISPEAEEDLRGRGCRVADATCPNVKKSQLKAKELIQDGYTLFLAGDAQHSEIIGILGYARSGAADGESVPCFVVSDEKEAEAAAIEIFEPDTEIKIALMAQTTLSEKKFKKIGASIKKFFSNLEIIETICPATAERQHALNDLLEQADAVIVAGGKSSANARQLLEIAKESGKPCELIEHAGEIPFTYFTLYETVGLCAGASTPDSVISEIEVELLR